MNYTIHIQDTWKIKDPLILHFAERNSPSLNHLGGDNFLQPIVSSELRYTLEVNNGADAAYEQYFTSDEQRYLVTKIISEEQDDPAHLEHAGEVVWQGYLLPESYSEPWENPLFYVNFSAVDGLGLLKGKKLSEDFYEEEKTVIGIISDCLRLTGLPFDIYLTPAIENHLQKNWNGVYFDTRHNVKDDKKESAYEILEKIIASMECQLYQVNASWYIEGINKRHIIAPEYYKYDIQGKYLGTVTVTKNVKEVDWSPGTLITMVPALKEVVVTHEAEQLSFPEDVVKENPQWKTQSGVVSQIYPKYWKYNQFYSPVMKAPDYYLELSAPNTGEIEENNSIRLKEKPYILAGWRVRVEISFELVPANTLYTSSIDEHLDANDWRYILMYAFFQGGKQKGSNLFDKMFPSFELKFGRDLKASGYHEFVASEDGYLDVLVYAPHQLVLETDIKGVKITGLTVEKQDQEKDYVYTEPVDEKSSRIEDIDLEISDDVSGLSPSFYLERQRAFDTSVYFYRVPVPVLDGFTLNGKNYSVVSLHGANLIEQYIDYVEYIIPYRYLKNLKVVYNLNGGNQMVVETGDILIDSGQFDVTVRNYKESTIDRTEWLQWTDAIYGVEKKRYAQVYAEILRKLFSKPYLRIEGTAQAPMKFNDIIKFKYKGQDKFFVVTNLEWFPDENESRVTLVEGFYSGQSFENIPPFVDAGPDIHLSGTDTTAQITEAVASDPNGFIVSHEWSQLEGDSPALISGAVQNPGLGNLSGDNYLFQYTVTDNEGLSSSDTMRVLRVNGYEITFEAVEEFDGWGQGINRQEHRYRINVTPEVPENEYLVITFDAVLKVKGIRTMAYLEVSRNGTGEFEIGERNTVSTLNFEETGSLSIRKNDVVEVLFYSQWNPLAGPSTADYSLRITEAAFQGENGVVTNLPVMKSYTHERGEN